MAIYSVEIPENSEVDSSVIDFKFTDDDYADFWSDYGLMYDDHDYFYLDTNKGTQLSPIST